MLVLKTERDVWVNPIISGRRVGFKPAGGLKTPLDALCYRVLVEELLGKEWLTPELLRFGATSLLDNVIKAL